ncbi:hypothetical protein C5167_047972 [Papaver somniferum]|uniref:Uncharacterized protein n=1 Tax=Papaver somniferum TaxID=3469 RepID=A0A4Y7KHZ8_PAPSO|nr:hypothetical protein C5167_047972 [Papaver somniferum]
MDWVQNQLTGEIPRLSTGMNNVKIRSHEKAKHTMGQKTFLDANLNWQSSGQSCTEECRFCIPISCKSIQVADWFNIKDWVQNQLTGEIPRLIYWDEVLQYFWRPVSRWPTTETVHALRNGADVMKSNPIGAAADFDEDEF